MAGAHPLLERDGIEVLRLSTFLTLDQCSPDRVHFSVALLLSAYQIADVFAVVCVVPRADLRLDPGVLLISQGDGFSHGAHGAISQVGRDINQLSYYWCD